MTSEENTDGSGDGAENGASPLDGGLLRRTVLRTAGAAGAASVGGVAAGSRGAAAGRALTIETFQDGPLVEYGFTVDGDVVKGSGADDNDTIVDAVDGTRVTGAVGNGYTDTYRVAAEPRDWSTNVDPKHYRVLLDGREVDVGGGPGWKAFTVETFSDGPLVEYAFTVEGDVVKGPAADASDRIAGTVGATRVTGNVGNGYTDTYYVTAEPTDWSANVDPEHYRVLYDGREMGAGGGGGGGSPGSDPSNTVTIETFSDGPLVEYTFVVDGPAVKSAEADASDTVTGTAGGSRITGNVGNGYPDTYRVASRPIGWSANVDPEHYRVLYNGRPIGGAGSGSVPGSGGDLDVRIVGTDAPVEGGDVLETTVAVENRGSTPVDPGVRFAVEGAWEPSTTHTGIDPGETQTFEISRRIPPAPQDRRVELRAAAGGESDRATVGVLGVTPLPAVRWSPRREVTVEPGTTVLFEVDTSGFDGKTRWFVDGRWEGVSFGPWNLSYPRDFWRRTFDSEGVYEVVAGVVGDDAGSDPDNATAGWTVRVRPDGNRAPTIDRVDPDVRTSIESAGGTGRVRVSDAEGDLDRVVWWQRVTDAPIGVENVSGSVATASVSTDATGAHPIVAWVVDTDGALLQRRLWE
jgi:hypothetical protein